MSDHYAIQFDLRQGLLRAHVSGHGSMANTVAYWSDIAEQVARLHPKSLLLIDELSGPPLSADEWMALVESLAGKGFETMRLAHVKPNGLEKIEFCEIYAKDAGLDARVFVSASVAELWLRHGEPRESDDDARRGNARRVESNGTGTRRD